MALTYPRGNNKSTWITLRTGNCGRTSSVDMLLMAQREPHSGIAGMEPARDRLHETTLQDRHGSASSSRGGANTLVHYTLWRSCRRCSIELTHLRPNCSIRPVPGCAITLVLIRVFRYHDPDKPLL